MKPNRGPVAAPSSVHVIVAMLVWGDSSYGAVTASVRPEKEVIATGWWTVLNSPQDHTAHSSRLASDFAQGRALFRNSLSSPRLMLSSLL